ncbi:MAG: hypothetical protein IPI30_09130 [Saprospiraceae bacterium]|nr:hypothetical protein [Candidatus Vicinibacter affinis]
MGCDFMKDELPLNNDIILGFNIIHGLNLAENEELAKKVYNSLSPGGMYVILDQIKGIGGNSQMSKATTSYMALNLCIRQEEDLFKNEIDSFVKKMGFKNTELKKLNAPGFGVVICHK